MKAKLNHLWEFSTESGLPNRRKTPVTQQPRQVSNPAPLSQGYKLGSEGQPFEEIGSTQKQDKQLGEFMYSSGSRSQVLGHNRKVTSTDWKCWASMSQVRKDMITGFKDLDFLVTCWSIAVFSLRIATFTALPLDLSHTIHLEHIPKVGFFNLQKKSHPKFIHRTPTFQTNKLCQVTRRGTTPSRWHARVLPRCPWLWQSNLDVFVWASTDFISLQINNVQVFLHRFHWFYFSKKHLNRVREQTIKHPLYQDMFHILCSSFNSPNMIPDFLLRFFNASHQLRKSKPSNKLNHGTML